MLTRTQTARPQIAVEIAADRVIAARVNEDRSSLDSYSLRRLPAGTVSPGISTRNILSPDTLAQALSAALETVGAQRCDLVLVLPDLAVRLLLMDFEQLPSAVEDAEGIIRFRLKKSLPFEIEQSALSFDVRRNGTAHVLAAVSPKEVLGEYEAALRGIGYAPGIVIPSLLGALGMIDDDRAVMLLKAEIGVTSVAIAHRGSVALVRTLEHPDRPDFGVSELAESVHPSMVYFEDTYGGRVERIVIVGANAPALAAGLQTEIGLPAEELGPALIYNEPMGDAVSRSVLTPVTGSLIG